MRVIVVEDDPITRMDIKTILLHEGIDVVGEGKDGIDAIQLCRTYKPDVVLLDINMPTLDGLSAIKIIRKDGFCNAIVIISAHADKEYLMSAKEVSVQGYLVKPFNKNTLITTLEIAMSSVKNQEKIKKQLDSVSKQLEDRKYIEKAKGKLMKSENITEEEAYKRIRTMSMEKNCTMRVISEIILLD